MRIDFSCKIATDCDIEPYYPLFPVHSWQHIVDPNPEVSMHLHRPVHWFSVSYFFVKSTKRPLRLFFVTITCLAQKRTTKWPRKECTQRNDTMNSRQKICNYSISFRSNASSVFCMTTRNRMWLLEASSKVFSGLVSLQLPESNKLVFWQLRRESPCTEIVQEHEGVLIVFQKIILHGKSLILRCSLGIKK